MFLFDALLGIVISFMVCTLLGQLCWDHFWCIGLDFIEPELDVDLDIIIVL